LMASALSSGLYFLFSLIPALPLHPNSSGRVHGSQYRSEGDESLSAQAVE
jgi:hypothetical protein